MYDISKMNVPTYLYYGDNDILADPTDVQFILKNAKSIVWSKEYNEFNHMDFIWGLRAAEEVYQVIIDRLKDWFGVEL